jgi:hypothetical protein
MIKIEKPSGQAIEQVQNTVGKLQENKQSRQAIGQPTPTKKPSGQAIEQVIETKSGQDKPSSDRTNDQTTERTSDRISDRTSDRQSDRTNDRTSDHVSD